MKYIVLLFSLVLMSCYKMQDSSAFSVMTFTGMYVGVTNPIKIRHSVIDCDRLLIVIEPDSGVNICKTGCGEFEVSGLRRRREGFDIKVYKDKITSRNLLLNQHCVTFSKPYIRASLGRFLGSNITRNQLAKVEGIKVYTRGLSFSDSTNKVLEYFYIFTPLNGSSIKGVVKNTSRLPKELRSAFSNAQHGDRVKIYGIKAFYDFGGEVLIDEELTFVVI